MNATRGKATPPSTTTKKKKSEKVNFRYFESIFLYFRSI